MGFKQGVASPCCYKHEQWNVQVVVHGDDFTSLGTDAGLDLFGYAMSKAFEVKLKGRFGHGGNDEKAMRVLNRILRISDHGLLYEPDPRHAELLIRSLGLEHANIYVTLARNPSMISMTSMLPATTSIQSVLQSSWADGSCQTKRGTM